MKYQGGVGYVHDEKKVKRKYFHEFRGKQFSKWIKTNLLWRHTYTNVSSAGADYVCHDKINNNIYKSICYRTNNMVITILGEALSQNLYFQLIVSIQKENMWGIY